MAASEVRKLKEMFPNYDPEVLTTIWEISGGSFNAAITTLLGMSEEVPPTATGPAPAPRSAAPGPAAAQPRSFAKALSNGDVARGAAAASPSRSPDPQFRPAIALTSVPVAPQQQVAPKPYRPPFLRASSPAPPAAPPAAPPGLPQANGVHRASPHPHVHAANGPGPPHPRRTESPLGAPAGSLPHRPARQGGPGRGWWPPWNVWGSSAGGRRRTPPAGRAGRACTCGAVGGGAEEELEVFVGPAGAGRAAWAPCACLPRDTWRTLAAPSPAPRPPPAPAFQFVYRGEAVEARHEALLSVSALCGIAVLRPAPAPAPAPLDEAAAGEAAAAVARSAAAAVLQDSDGEGGAAAWAAWAAAPGGGRGGLRGDAGVVAERLAGVAAGRAASGSGSDYSGWGEEALVEAAWAAEELWREQAEAFLAAGGASAAFLGDEDDALLESKYSAMQRPPRARRRRRPRPAPSSRRTPRASCRRSSPRWPRGGGGGAAGARGDVEAAVEALALTLALADPPPRPRHGAHSPPSPGPRPRPLGPRLAGHCRRAPGEPRGRGGAAAAGLVPPPRAPRDALAVPPPRRRRGRGGRGREERGRGGGERLLRLMKLADLAESFPSAEAEALEAALVACEGDKPAAAALLRQSFPTRRELDASLQPPPAPARRRSPRPARGGRRGEAGLDWRSEFSLPSLGRRLHAPDAPAADDELGWRRVYGRERAGADGEQRRHVALAQSAARAFAAGSGRLAAELSRRAAAHGERAAALHRAAADALFAARNAALDNLETLDLHGLHCREAAAKLAAHPFLAPAPPPDAPPPPGRFLTIIAGAGNHSDGLRPRLRPEVEAFLKGRALPFSEPEPGVFRVRLLS
eukprot:tig00000237_g20485.t1